MQTKELVVHFEEGLHARPAFELSKVCQKYKCDISLEADEMKVDPKSILGIMTLGAGKGSKVTITTNGEDEIEAMESIEKLFEA